MAAPGPEKRSNGAVIDRALEIGLQRAAQPEPDLGVRLLLTQAQQDMMTDLCNVLELSVRTLLNAALSYALYCSERSGVPLKQMKEYPRRLSGKEITFDLTLDTLAKLREAGMLESVGHCAVAGLKLLHANTLAITSER